MTYKEALKEISEKLKKYSEKPGYKESYFKGFKIIRLTYYDDKSNSWIDAVNKFTALSNFDIALEFKIFDRFNQKCIVEISRLVEEWEVKDCSEK